MNQIYKYLELFTEMLQAERNSADNTIESYNLDLKNFLQYASDNNKSIENIDEKFINEYLGVLKISKSSLSRKISSIKQFFKFLHQEKIINNNPAKLISKPKKSVILPKFLDESQVRSLLEILNNSDSLDIIRLNCMLHILYASGLRVTELVTLSIKSLSFNNYPKINDGIKPFITVKGKGDKERIVPLYAKAVDAIVKYLSLLKITSHNNFLFPSYGKDGHITRQRFGQLLKQLALLANIDPSMISPHVIRHSFATHLMNNGLDIRSIQELLGHSDIATTQVYTHVAVDKLKKLVFNHHPISRRI
jgi:integrase/recombinase XerD